jgi:hypothetical protein
MPDDDPRVITLRRSTVVRAGVAVLVLAALGGGIVIGLVVAGSSPATHATSASTNKHKTGATTTSISSPPTTTAVPATTTTAALPIITLGGFSGRYPTEIAFSADGGNVVTGITWSSWTANGAVGNGTWTYENCVPDCVHGSQTPYPATITLSNPVGGQFTTLTEYTAMMGTASYALPGNNETGPRGS